MQYKKLTEKDFTTGYGSTVEFTEALTTNDYTSVTLNSSGFASKQIKNIINGGEVNLTTGTVLVLNRSKFKEQIHISSFRYNGTTKLTNPTILASGAGPAYTDGTVTIFPEVGMIHSGGSVGTVVANSEVITTTSYVYIRARNKEFNYSTNPSFSDIQGNIRFRELKDNPVVYITTIGLYNDNGDLLAVAKVPPTKKTFEEEVLFQVQLDF